MPEVKAKTATPAIPGEAGGPAYEADHALREMGVEP